MQKKSRILLAEDEEDQLSLFKDILEEEGYEVIACSNGIQALEHIHRDVPDLLVLDIKLPEVSGEDVLKTVLKENLAPHMKVLIMTGYYDYDVTRKRIENDCRDRIIGYLQKPVDEQRFKKIIFDALSS